jgi:hypothetical protein
MNTFEYAPVIKCNRSHVAAVDQLFPKEKGRIKPIFEIPLRPSTTSIDDHLRSAMAALSSRVGGGDFFFDPYGFLPDDTVQGHSAAQLAIVQASKLGATVICGLENQGASTQFIARKAKETGRGLAFRVPLDLIAFESEDTWEEIFSLSGDVGLNGDEIDLLIDFRSVSDVSIDAIREQVIDFLTMRPRSFVPRTVVLIGSSALPSVSTIEKNGGSSVRRREYDLWASIQFELGDSYSLAYGDYGIVHPDLIISGPNKNANGKIRYTEGPFLHYFRGHALFDPEGDGFGQYRQIAKRVVESSAYQGRGFSAGDQAIYDCAVGLHGPGNLATWVRNDLNHHLTYVSRQIQVVKPRLIRADSLRDVNAIVSAS